MRTYFTSESVTEGHPDKLCDQISDAVLDAILEKDKNARVACETCATTGMVMVMGEITTNASVNIREIAKNVILDVGYNNGDLCFDGNSCAILTSIHEQSPDIAMGVDEALETRAENAGDIGAGDQGMMFGFACDETEEYMPMPIAMANRLALKLSQLRKSGELPYLRPDGKTQVTVAYENGAPKEITTVLISTQHSPDVSHETIERDLTEKCIRAVLPKELLAKNLRILINPTGRFVLGGPAGDSGLTGRKIIVDTYGGYARHGGGCFSGKDPTKVDRSAAYAARHAAKNIVAAGLAKACEIQVAYAIGVAKPLSIYVDTRGTGVIPDDKLSEIIPEVFDLRPASIIERFDLRRPIYRKTAAYGHFGRTDIDLPWERLDCVDKLREKARV
jgi:S-adenosylmethionine synthetase